MLAVAEHAAVFAIGKGSASLDEAQDVAGLARQFDYLDRAAGGLLRGDRSARWRGRCREQQDEDQPQTKPVVVAGAWLRTCKNGA